MLFTFVYKNVPNTYFQMFFTFIFKKVSHIYLQNVLYIYLQQSSSYLLVFTNGFLLSVYEIVFTFTYKIVHVQVQNFSYLLTKSSSLLYTKIFLIPIYKLVFTFIYKKVSYTYLQNECSSHLFTKRFLIPTYEMSFTLRYSSYLFTKCSSHYLQFYGCSYNTKRFLIHIHIYLLEFLITIYKLFF